MHTLRDHPALKRTLLALGLGLAVPVSAKPATDNPPEALVSADRPSNNAPGKKRKNKPAASTAPRKQPVAAADYAQWERLGGHQFSRDGRWLAHAIQRVDETRTLHLQDVRSHKDTPAASFPQGERPVFSNDSAWLAVGIGKSPAELKKAAKPGDSSSAGRKLLLRRLRDGDTTELENVGAFRFSANSRFAAIEISPPSANPPSASTKPSGAAPPPGSRPAPGKTLVVRDLHSGHDTTIRGVVRHAWSDRGALLALVIDSPSISNALQVFDPGRESLRTLESSDQDYTALAWRDDSTDLAAMREMKHDGKEDASHVLLAWRNLDKAKTTSFILDHGSHPDFPAEMFIASGTLAWSEDGQSIACDLQAWERKPKHLAEEQSSAKKTKKTKKTRKKDRKDRDAEGGHVPPQEERQPPKAHPAPGSGGPPPPADTAQPGPATLRESLKEDSNVEVWHSKDVDIMPRQKKMADKIKNPKRRAVWWLENGTLVQLGNELTEEVTILRSGTHAVGRDHTPHERTAMFGPRLQDVFLIDTRTGKRERILEAVKHLLTPSPDGRYLLYLRDGHVWSHEVRTGRQRNLTGGLATHFTDQEDDSLEVEKRPYGRATWMKDGSSVLLDDRFDIWRLTPDGSSAVKLTAGAGEMVRHRLSQASFDDDDDGSLDPDHPLFLALFGERSKKSGYARLHLDRNPKNPGRVDSLIWEDRQVSSLTKAADAGVYALVREGSDDSPDLFVGGPNLRKARRITNTNAFQKGYLWGQSRLVEFTNKDGTELQGMLTYPAGYVAGTQYPMIVYIYEKRSDGLHHYPVPSEKHPYNQAVYSAEGYFVFQPDIVYRPQEPGLSALDCVVPAVEAVLATGMVDETRIGLVGHSWGAYQTAFIVTRSDLFAAGVAGAPLTDMMSMASSVYWNSGQPNARIFAQSQGRMDKPFWRDVDNYVRNSPIHGLDTLETPLLIAFGDQDGAVDWDQGVQMYNAARWAGKDNLVMLVYPGENHGLRKEENMVDYHYRILDWFGHYLQSSEAPKWITEGKSFLDRQKELEAKKENQGRKPGPGQEQAGAKPKASAPARPPAKPAPRKTRCTKTCPRSGTIASFRRIRPPQFPARPAPPSTSAQPPDGRPVPSKS